MRIVLIHGFGCGPTDWSGQVAPLTACADVFAVELPGERRARHAAASLIVEMANVVNDARGPVPPVTRTVLVGHSLGCRVALEAARRQPAGVAGIVLIEGSLRAVGDAAAAVHSYRSRSDGENMALLKHDFAGMFSVATPEAFRRVVLQRLDLIDSNFALRLMTDMTRWDAAEAVAALRAVQAPMLVIQSTFKVPGGERRPIGLREESPWLRLIAEQAEDRSSVVRLAGLGHFPQVEAPSVVNALIRAFTERVGAC